MNSPDMAAKKTTNQPSKSDFIRQQPSSMSVADVIAKGQEAGIKFTSSLVYMVRGRQDGKATPKKASGKKSSSKKPGAKKTSTKVSAPKKTATTSKTTAPKKSTESKAEFVRARAHLSPREIVEDAKGQGIKLDPSYVYNVRGYDKTAAKTKTVAKKGSASQQPTPSSTTPKSAPASKPTPSNGSRSSGSVEELLKAAAAELGLGRAIEILHAERAKVRAVLGG